MRKSVTEQERRPDRRRARSDAAIRDAFTGLLTEKDLGKITVKELAERANIDRKTFYLRYESLDGLIDDMLQEEAERVADILAQAHLRVGEASDMQAMFEAMDAELLTGFDRRAAIMGHVDRDTLIAKLAPLLAAELAERNALQLSDDLGPYLPLFVGFFCAGLLNLYRQWMESGADLPLEDVATLANAAVAGGIASLSHTARELGAA